MWLSRVVTYQEQGSVRLTPAERRAYAVLVDIRIVSVVRKPFETYKSNPPTSFYGRATVFHGSVPFSVQDIVFPKQRILNTRNEQAATTYNQLAIAADQNRAFTDLGEIIEAIWQRFNELKLAPLLQHKETIIKFKGIPLSQFEITVWRLEFEDGVGFQLPAQDEDPTRDDDEYYEPLENPVENPYGGNPAPSDPDDGSDPRDFGEQDPNPGLIPGSLQFFSSGNNSPTTQKAPIPGLFWPGQLVVGNDPNFAVSAAWLDDEGNFTNVGATNFPPLFIELAEFQADDGRLFVPEPNTITVN